MQSDLGEDHNTFEYTYTPKFMSLILISEKQLFEGLAEKIIFLKRSLKLINL